MQIIIATFSSKLFVNQKIFLDNDISNFQNRSKARTWLKLHYERCKFGGQVTGRVWLTPTKSWVQTGVNLSRGVLCNLKGGCSLKPCQRSRIYFHCAKGRRVPWRSSRRFPSKVRWKAKKVFTPSDCLLYVQYITFTPQKFCAFVCGGARPQPPWIRPCWGWSNHKLVVELCWTALNALTYAMTSLRAFG